MASVLVNGQGNSVRRIASGWDFWALCIWGCWLLLYFSLFYFESLRGEEKQTLDPVDRCVGAEPGAIYAVDMSLELLEVGSGGHFPSFNVLSPPIASQTYKLTLRRALWKSWLPDINIAWALGGMSGLRHSQICGELTLGSQIKCPLSLCLQHLTASFPGLHALKVDDKCFLSPSPKMNWERMT